MDIDEVPFQAPDSERAAEEPADAAAERPVQRPLERQLFEPISPVGEAQDAPLSPASPPRPNDNYANNAMLSEVFSMDSSFYCLLRTAHFQHKCFVNVGQHRQKVAHVTYHKRARSFIRLMSKLVEFVEHVNGTVIYVHGVPGVDLLDNKVSLSDKHLFSAIAVALCEPASRRMMAIPPLSLQDAAADAFFRVAGPNDREGARKLLDKLNVGASSLQTALRFLEGLVSVLLSSVRQDPKLLQLQQLRNCVVLQLESYIEAIQTIRPALKTARDDLGTQIAVYKKKAVSGVDAQVLIEMIAGFYGDVVSAVEQRCALVCARARAALLGEGVSDEERSAIVRDAFVVMSFIITGASFVSLRTGALLSVGEAAQKDRAHLALIVGQEVPKNAKGIVYVRVELARDPHVATDDASDSTVDESAATGSRAFLFVGAGAGQKGHAYYGELELANTATAMMCDMVTSGAFGEAVLVINCEHKIDIQHEYALLQRQYDIEVPTVLSDLPTNVHRQGGESDQRKERLRKVIADVKAYEDAVDAGLKNYPTDVLQSIADSALQARDAVEAAKEVEAHRRMAKAFEQEARAQQELENTLVQKDHAVTEDDVDSDDDIDDKINPPDERPVQCMLFDQVSFNFRWLFEITLFLLRRRKYRSIERRRR